MQRVVPSPVLQAISRGARNVARRTFAYHTVEEMPALLYNAVVHDRVLLEGA